MIDFDVCRAQRLTHDLQVGITNSNGTLTQYIGRERKSVSIIRLSR